VKETARYLGRDICAVLQTLRLKKTTAEWMKKVAWRDWGKMAIRLETFTSLKRVVAMNNEGLRNIEVAGLCC
jgi:hypothetical protein